MAILYFEARERNGEGEVGEFIQKQVKDKEEAVELAESYDKRKWDLIFHICRHDEGKPCSAEEL